MPELMQLGPDDIEINPPFSPCPADYPPCPLCGKHPDMLESGHIICCNIVVDNSDAWFLLPRALTWTHEPPKVAGWYWVRLMDDQYLPQIAKVTLRDIEIGFEKTPRQWAGPIASPQEVPHA